MLRLKIFLNFTGVFTCKTSELLYATRVSATTPRPGICSYFQSLTIDRCHAHLVYSSMDPATTPKKTDSSEIEVQKSLSPASLNEMESRMRDEIRKLQERRVTVLMDEVTQLQSERDKFLAKISSLEKENQVLKEENSTLKANEKPSIQVTVLERALQQEKDEKDKLKQRLRVIKKRTSSQSITNLNRERSGSMNDVDTESTDVTETLVNRAKPKVELKPAPSPRGKRYVLAATSTKEVGTQTTLIPHADIMTAKDDDDDKKTTLINEDMRTALSEARSTIIEILQEKEVGYCTI